MSRVYGVRTRSLHDDGLTDPTLARNPHILAWWTEEHDRLVARRAPSSGTTGSGIGRLVSETWDLPTRIRGVEALHGRPALARVKNLFGSWRAACAAASGHLKAP